MQEATKETCLPSEANMGIDENWVQYPCLSTVYPQISSNHINSAVPQKSPLREAIAGQLPRV